MNNANNNKLLFGGGGAIIGLLLGLLISPMMPYGEMMSWGINQNSSSRTTSTSLIDQHFIEQMIPHHQGAIDMANLALEKTTHPEIKTLAEAIIQAQTTENQTMSAWYLNWFGRNVPESSTALLGGMMARGGMHMGSVQDLDVLKSTPDFDKEFIEQMIPHHQMAIMMARMLEAGTNRPEMQQLAKNIIRSQSEEIEQMQVWYASWYK